MQKLLFAILLLLISKNSKSQSDSLLISKKEIKGFFTSVKQLISAESHFLLSNKPVSDLPKRFFEENLSRDTFLTKKDIDFISMQSIRTKKVIFDSSLINDVIFIKSSNIDSVFNKKSLEDGWNQFHKLYGSDYYELSLPYFSINKETYVLIVGYNCGGLCLALSTGGVKNNH